MFVTGPPGTGKTTLLFTVLREHPVGPGGFVVKRVYQHGRRVAMDLVDLATRRRARLVSFAEDGHGRVVTPEAFAAIGVPAVRSAVEAGRLVVMDELGRFELAVPDFMAVVEQALDSPVPVVGVLKGEANPFLDRVRARPDVRLIELGHPPTTETWETARVAFEAALTILLGPRRPAGR